MMSQEMLLPGVGADLCLPPIMTYTQQPRANTRVSPPPQVVQWFKTLTTNEYIRGVKKSN